MSDLRGAGSRARIAVVLALIGVSGVSIRGHVPGWGDDVVAAAIGAPVLLIAAVVVLCFAFLVSAGRYMARIGELHRKLMREPAAEHIGAPTQGPRIRALVVTGICLVPLAEFIARCLPGRGDVQALAGVVVGLLLLGMCSQLRVAKQLPTDLSDADDVGEPLQRWLFRTESLIVWSEGSRSDWDRRVRPVVARHFEKLTKGNQRRTTDPAAFQATGIMVFGAELWRWVDPNNVVRQDGLGRAPGRATLEAILRCLEQV